MEELASDDDQDNLRQDQEKVKDNVLCRVARAYSQKVEDWFQQRENLLKEAEVFAFAGIELNEAIEVINWYKYFIPDKLARALQRILNGEETWLHARLFQRPGIEDLN